MVAMQKKSNRFVIWIAGLAVAALLLADLLPTFAVAREVVTPVSAQTVVDDGRILVAQAEQPRRRRTLFDLLFGDEPAQQRQEAPVVKQAPAKQQQQQKKASLPPAKPKIEKAPGATRLMVFGDSMASDLGKALDRLYEEDPNLAIINQGVGSSSFVRPDFFDWPKAVANALEKDEFDVAVFFIGINDRQKMNQAMMELYKTEKINPLGGCFPILVQIPVFIALYWTLLAAIELRHAPFILWIKDLSALDPYYVLPVLMAITMILQTKMNPVPPDPVQAKVMQFMPYVFSVFFFFFPAGLVLYWLVNNILSIGQQWQIQRMFDRDKTAHGRR